MSIEAAKTLLAAGIAAEAYWVSRDAIVWDIPASPGYTYRLHTSAEGALRLSNDRLTGGQEWPLTFSAYSPGKPVLDKYPHLTGLTTLKLDPAAAEAAPILLKGQLAVSAYDSAGVLVDVATLQIPGVLDDLYSYTGPLGVTFIDGRPVLRVWAPTARTVMLQLHPDSKLSSTIRRYAMAYDPLNGVWTIHGEPSWAWKYYLYEVEVYVPSLGKFMLNQVTDPYSVSLSMNSTLSQIVDLAHPSLLPPGWASLPKPPLEAPEDIVIYELHVRDFSIFDPTIPAEHRGKYLAFTDKNSNGMKHLKALAQAGLTHLELMPVFDFASVKDDPAQRREPDPLQLAALPGDSKDQQAILAKFKDRDGFNWGYDPFHFTTPEGSYATDPNGPGRILEFRQMVQALNLSGLRVIMDVVYNHTYTSGQTSDSVLDRIVPGYYHRLNSQGAVESSTCCANTASEHTMMEKLMIDSLRTWATAYKIDGFRFDLMGHHMLENMIHARQALDALTPDEQGVDGKGIYMLGEGWNFGEVGNNNRGRNATQANIAGTGIGVFNDRLRDAARGGNPFSFLTDQGFITGLYDDPNTSNQGTAEEQRQRLIHTMDWLRLSMAGNLKDYRLVREDGWPVRGAEIYYNGVPAAFAADPQENLVYISSHDNHTLFDSVQMKAPPSASLDERVRMHNLGIDVVMLSQGVPFFCAGDDLLRSKSLDSNSYNSGDWFNRLDFSGETNNWAVGLPANQQVSWPFMQPLLANPALKPTRQNIQAAAAHFQEMLSLRKSSRLFRLRNAEQVIQRLKFYNTGPGQLPGLLVMALANPDLDLDPQMRLSVVLINSCKTAVTYAEDAFTGVKLVLHPILAASQDPIVRQSSFDPADGAFSIPGRTTAVFVAR